MKFTTENIINAIKTIYDGSNWISTIDISNIPLVKPMNEIIIDGEQRGLDITELKYATNHFNFNFTDKYFRMLDSGTYISYSDQELIDYISDDETNIIKDIMKEYYKVINYYRSDTTANDAIYAMKNNKYIDDFEAFETVAAPF